MHINKEQPIPQVLPKGLWALWYNRQKPTRPSKITIGPRCAELETMLMAPCSDDTRAPAVFCERLFLFVTSSPFSKWYPAVELNHYSFTSLCSFACPSFTSSYLKYIDIHIHVGLPKFYNAVSGCLYISCIQCVWRKVCSDEPPGDDIASCVACTRNARSFVPTPLLSTRGKRPHGRSYAVLVSSRGSLQLREPPSYRKRCPSITRYTRSYGPTCWGDQSRRL
ncbi:hypothetical protein BC835DRAFT_1372932 [Cytidiella melzeri]|nr:hypothetical protein BC835DRAFT_1372932 [Cytidiella melzeri]